MSERLRRRLRRTPPGYRYSIGRILLVYAGLMVTVLLAALDQSIVATALPRIVSDIGGLSGYSWVFSGYLLFQTVTVPLYGQLGDIFGRRRLLFVAIVVFLAGSALCGLAQNMTELVLFRCLQGIGAGGLMPLVWTTIGELVPARDRGRYHGLIAAAFGSASILGPALGGVIVDHTTWRWIFYVNLPIGAVALTVVALTMPGLADGHGRSVDYLGALLLGGGTGSILVALVWGGKTHPWISPYVLGALATGLLLLGAFALHERRVEETLVPFAILRQPTVAAGAACMGLASMCQFGTIAFVPLFVQGVIGTSATSSGVALTPLLLGGVVASIASGQWVARTGRYRGNVLLGPVLLGAGMALLWRMDVHTTTGEAARNMVVAGLGVGLMMPVFILIAQNAVPDRVIGTTTAFMQFARSIGTTFGATVFGVIVNHGLPPALRGRDLAAHRLAPQARADLAAAIRPAYLFATGVSVLVLVLAFRGVKGPPLRRTFDEDPPASDPEVATGLAGSGLLPDA